MVKSLISKALLFVENVGFVLDRVEVLVANSVLDGNDCEDVALNGKVVSVEIDRKAVELNLDSVTFGRDGEAFELKPLSVSVGRDGKAVELKP